MHNMDISCFLTLVITASMLLNTYLHHSMVSAVKNMGPLRGNNSAARSSCSACVKRSVTSPLQRSGAHIYRRLSAGVVSLNDSICSSNSRHRSMQSASAEGRGGNELLKRYLEETSSTGFSWRRGPRKGPSNDNLPGFGAWTATSDEGLHDTLVL